MPEKDKFIYKAVTWKGLEAVCKHRVGGIGIGEVVCKYYERLEPKDRPVCWEGTHCPVWDEFPDAFTVDDLDAAVIRGHERSFHQYRFETKPGGKYIVFEQWVKYPEDAPK